MKLALILLTFSCVYVSVTHQQRLMHQRHFPLTYYYYNSFYDLSKPLSRNNLVRPLFAARNDYVQPINHPSFDEQTQMVITFKIYGFFLIHYFKLLATF